MTEMTAQRWERAQSIFARVADLPQERQRHFVEGLCGADEQMSGTVLAMLEEDGKQQRLLDGDLSGALGQVADVALGTDQMAALVERHIGPYRLIRVLGEGGMGIVYLAERTGIGGLVAIKLLRDAWLSPMRRERFALEQQTLVKLNHPAIARLYDASTTEDGTPWFVMEYADGQPLTDYLRNRAAGVREDLVLFRQVCEAVRYAHGMAIIHCDLKPSNIFVTADGQVKLLDFGIAKQMSPDAQRGKRTVAGLRLLTPGYAAPEQSAGGAVGVFTDVYSLGVLLYEILTGQLPEVAETRGEKAIDEPSLIVRRCVAAGKAIEIGRQQWADLDLICLTSLEFDPERRYRSVDALVRDVNAYLEERVLEARPPSLAYTVGKFARRNRLGLASVAAGLMVLIGAVVYFTVHLARARDTAVAEAARTTRIQHFMLDMLGNGDQEAGPSNDLKVTTLLDREAQQAVSLNEDAQTQIDLYGTLGEMYDRLGKFDKAGQMLTLALDKATQTDGAQSAKVAALLIQLGTLHGDQGDLKTAQKEVQGALDLAARNHLRSNDPTMIQGRIAMGRVYLQSGEFQKSIDALTPIAAMDLKQPGTDPKDVRDSIAALAIAQLSSQHYDLAAADGNRAVDLDRKLLGEAHPQTGIDLVNLASVKATQGDLPAAERLYREGIGVMKGWYGLDQPDVATASGILGRILSAEGKDTEAEPLLIDALRIQEKTYGPVHERVAYTLNSLGEIASRRQELSLAEADFKQAMTIDRTLFGETDYKTAMNESNLGNVYLKESRLVLAETTLSHAVASVALLPSGNNMIGTVRGRWGRALLALHKYAAAETQLNAAEKLLQAQPGLQKGELQNVEQALSELHATRLPTRILSESAVIH